VTTDGTMRPRAAPVAVRADLPVFRSLRPYMANCATGTVVREGNNMKRVMNMVAERKAEERAGWWPLSRAAQALGLSTSQARRWCRSGRLDGRQVGGARCWWRVSAESVRRLLTVLDGPAA
jgi:hypothetical protein